MAYVKFTDIPDPEAAEGQEDPAPGLASLATLARGQAQTSKQGQLYPLVQQQTHSIDIINVFAPTAAQTKNEPAPFASAKVAKLAKVAAPQSSTKQATQPPDWWRDEYEERAAIREFDGRYTRAEAERLAWGELENRWHTEYGERVPAAICAGCRRPIGQARALDVADGTRVHGTDCLIEFGKRWRGAATHPLVQLGYAPRAYMMRDAEPARPLPSVRLPDMIGIDPGLSGAIATLDAATGAVLDVLDMPTLMLSRGGKAKRELDAHALARLLGAQTIGHCFIEAVGAMPGQGVSSVFAFGKSYGVVLGILAALGLPLTLVAPTVWKKALQVPAAKDAARYRASQLMAAAAHHWRLVKHDGRAEAALIAYHGCRSLQSVAA